MAEPAYFQWQNEILLKDIYPMRDIKLQDFLEYYAEIDIWKQYKDKDITGEIQQYLDAQKRAATTALNAYTAQREYFLRPDVRSEYIKFNPLDEAEMTEINRLHGVFVQYWPKDVRGERYFLTTRKTEWETHVKRVQTDIKSRKNYLAAMIAGHPNRKMKEDELRLKEHGALPMAQQEMKRLDDFFQAYERIEARKLDWYRRKQKDPTFNVPEVDFLLQPVSNQQPTPRDIARWKAQVYKESIANKKQYELLDEIQQRFKMEPQRYPLWLQYMVVHFSGMRYKTAHNSWADPRDLLDRLRAVPAFGKDLQGLDQTAIKSLTTRQALDKLKSMKGSFPAWAWKQIVALTPLRVTEVTATGWEALTPQEQSESYRPQHNALRNLLGLWKDAHTTGWREEHARTHELIVTRAVCNEAAEHIQHLRGHKPFAGLTNKPKWYRGIEDENKVPGDPRPYFVKPDEETDFTPGASILWLRFVDKKPDQWQRAEPISTRDGVGLIPPEFLNRKPQNKKGQETKGKDQQPKIGRWVYQPGAVPIMRSRALYDEKQRRRNQNQWLRWLHEATVVEVAETADGKVVLTFETSLPDGDPGVSSVGMFRRYLSHLLATQTEDDFNGSFVGYVPEGQVPVEHLNETLDWNKIMRKSAAPSPVLAQSAR